MNKETAVDYLFEKLCGENGYVDTYYMDIVKKIEAIYEQAKAMEREQIIDAHKQGEEFALVMNMPDSKEYYNETYKGGEQ